MKLLEKHAIPILILCLLVPAAVPYPITGYLATVLMLVFIVINKKSLVFILFIYFPARPLFMELNGGLTYSGDLIIVLLFLSLLMERFKKKNWSFSTYHFTMPFWLFCLIGTMAALITGVGILPILFELRALLITFLLLYIIGELNLERKDIFLFLKATLVFTIILCLHGLIEKIFSRTILLPHEWEMWNLSSANRMRIYGASANPNVFALYLSIQLFFSFFLYRSLKKSKFLVFLASILIFGTLLLTYSRGTMIAFGLAALVFVLWTKNKSFLIYSLGAFGLGLLLVYYPVIFASSKVELSAAVPLDNLMIGSNPTSDHEQALSSRFSEMFSDKILHQSTEWGRLYVVFKGVEIFKDHPVIGTGLATFGDSATLSFPSPIYGEYKIGERMYTDNQYIQILVQTGLLGFGAVLTFILLAFRKIKASGHGTFAAFTGCLLLAALTAGLFYNILEDKTFTVIFYSCLGFILQKDIILKD
ncbi:O-antigen ligase family protein [Peribacillus muralis]|uniref:O-antigen ligase family protein n=1 Tax=Peribacillus muralis TaxID=264697 RepID=UPI0007089FBC|nr:O-antigen ligase family protein [Peribacillus muralis]